MPTSAPLNSQVLALPEPRNDEYQIANRTIIAVFSSLGARISQITNCSITAEIQPDTFICANLRTYGPKRGMIRWAPSYANQTDGDGVCYLAANRTAETLAREVRRRVYPVAVAHCKSSRERCRKAKDTELVGEIRRAQLEAIMGELTDRRDEVINSDFSLILSKYELEHPEHSIRTTITVRNWHCFLMIAKLLAEDARLAK